MEEVAAEQPKTTRIYTLSDPRNGTVRYVGMSADPVSRLRQHWQTRTRRRSPIRAWLIELVKVGAMPIVETVEVVPFERRSEAEARWMRFHGATILNDGERAKNAQRGPGEASDTHGGPRPGAGRPARGSTTMDNLTVRIEPALHAKLKAHAVERGEDVSAIVRRLIEREVSR